MDQLKVRLKNCYGIQALDYDFDFSSPARKPKNRAYAIYAPNGLMKTSFSKTFEALSKGDEPREERYGRAATFIVEADGVAITADKIYVLKSEIDTSENSKAITNILVSPDKKSRYDELLVDLDKHKNKMLGSLQKISKVKKNDLEQSLLNDWDASDLGVCITTIKGLSIADDLAPYEYNTIFDPKALEVLRSPEFAAKAADFNQRYQELFDQAGTIYLKGVFNPSKADASFETLKKKGFFESGHRVHLRGETSSIDQDELDEKIRVIHTRIDEDDALKKLRLGLANNAQTQALAELIERLPSTQVEFLFERLHPENQKQFRRDLWVYYVNSSKEADAYADYYFAHKDEIAAIEIESAMAAPRWTKSVDLWNDRFVDMPFTLSVANQASAALGKENAKLKFTFKDGPDTVEMSRGELKTLSQGEKRALYLLNFIFEVEDRIINKKETLFVIDDVADSFDYKNKHAIVQYLEDICDTDYFHQIILTHNFDFFRTVAGNFVLREKCLMANRNDGSITLAPAKVVNNYFTMVWKSNPLSSDCILCATIPFTRNLIEYTKNEKHQDYLALTNLLHWKRDSANFTVSQYLNIYNALFGAEHKVENDEPVVDLMFRNAEAICIKTEHVGLNLEDKVLLSMTIRLKAEIYLLAKLRIALKDSEYWCEELSQYGYLMKQYIRHFPSSENLTSLEKVSITVSSNIHLNSFMYEPILDLTIEHLIRLYSEISALE